MEKGLPKILGDENFHPVKRNAVDAEWVDIQICKSGKSNASTLSLRYSFPVEPPYYFPAYQRINQIHQLDKPTLTVMLAA
ncbi:MAG: hypothetical protein IPM82_32035 [Saprospiraceae bacterium]|nr:hypothetical protein [Saprospiraceae bacterium]